MRFESEGTLVKLLNNEGVTILRLWQLDGPAQAAAAAERLNTLVEPEKPTGVEAECWHWPEQAASSIPRTKVPDSDERRPHRIIWEAFHGEVPEGHQVFRRCRSATCCNPDHLFLGKDADNPRIPARFGQDHHKPAARLTVALVREAREQRAEGALIRELAVRYGCDKRAISRAVRGITWKNVPMPDAEST
jgi:HNH endonuclease